MTNYEVAIIHSSENKTHEISGAQIIAKQPGRQCTATCMLKWEERGSRQRGPLPIFPRTRSRVPVTVQLYKVLVSL